jgi:hypothetical protein
VALVDHGVRGVAMTKDQIVHFPRLGEEGRFVPRQRRLVLQQRGVRAECGETHGRETQRLQQLVPALAPGRGERRVVDADCAKQIVPVLARDPLEPDMVGPYVKYFGNDVAQEVMVGRGWQQIAQQASQQAAHETLVGQRSWVRVQDAVHASAEQGAEVRVERSRELRSVHQQAREHTQTMAVPAAWPGYHPSTMAGT